MKLRESANAPQSWNDFRAQLASAMLTAGIPEHVADEVSDTGYMAGDLVQRLREAWREWEAQGYESYEDFLEFEAAPAVISHLARRSEVDDAESFRQPLIDALTQS